MRSQRNRFVVAILPALMIGMLAGCGTGGVNQGQINLVSLEEEWQLGQQLEADIAKQMEIVRDPTVVNYVNRLGQQIVAQTEMRNLPWEFHVVRDDEINAFNIPGGHVYVTTGLINATDNVAELAGVMAHEISHGVSRHGTEQLTKQYGLSIVAGLLLGENPAAYQQILAQIVGAGTLARFSRGAEREADELGVGYMYRAGYDPRGMITMFQELLAKERRSPSAVERFFSTHPLTQERINDVSNHVASLPAKSGLTTTDSSYQRIRQIV